MELNLVSLYAADLYEIKCETEIEDADCQEIEYALDYTEDSTVKICLLNLVKLVKEYEMTVENSQYFNNVMLNAYIGQSIAYIMKQYTPVNWDNVDLRIYFKHIDVDRHELAILIEDFANILR
ncbi:hypothetical protein [Bacillus thuringiensis]|uniref:hypothetical protein n=1 Tax=Bacillus cereus group TaxID=86661 RepID=UPI0002F2A1D8|nr:hypothetical protein [Bacillus thuringiensis]